MATLYAERDYPEDAEHENGNYVNLCSQCSKTFVGIKGRHTCRLCHLASRLFIEKE